MTDTVPTTVDQREAPPGGWQATGRRSIPDWSTPSGRRTSLPGAEALSSRVLGGGDARGTQNLGTRTRPKT